jgi:hypothetical protein
MKLKELPLSKLKIGIKLKSADNFIGIIKKMNNEFGNADITIAWSRKGTTDFIGNYLYKHCNFDIIYIPNKIQRLKCLEKNK